MCIGQIGSSIAGLTLMSSLLDVVFVGGGPAGCGPLIHAFQSGHGAKIDQTRFAIVESTQQLCLGALDKYAIRSNSYASSFIECVEAESAEPFLTDLQHTASYQWLKRYRTHVVPLPIVARFYKRLGKALAERITETRHGRCLFGVRATSARRERGIWHVGLSGGVGEREIKTRRLVMATGGQHVPLPTTRPHVTAGEVFHPRWRTTAATVSIVGGSHSAWSAAWMILKRCPSIESITIFSQSRPRAYFDNAASATATGYQGFEANDICPLTQRVFRLGGLRGDARNLFLNPDPRVQWKKMSSLDQALSGIPESHLLVSALGYQPRCIPLSDESGPIQVARQNAVDLDCHLLDQNQVPVPGVVSIGLGMGYKLPSDMGGEASFSGQTNGLWLYQNDVGRRLLDSVFDSDW